MSHRYPSDITREQFARIRPLLESARKKTKPRRVDLYDVFCGVLYVLRSGCRWRMLPADFPKWRTCHEYFRIWSEQRVESRASLLEDCLKKIHRGGPHTSWAEREDELLYRRCPEREEHGYRETQRV